MENRIGGLLEIIQTKTRETLDEIAEKTGYSRPYLSKSKADKKESEAVYKRLTEVYKDILPKDTSGNNEKGHLKKTDSLLDREDRLIWAIASITKLSEEVVKLQSVIYGRDVVDCVAELDRSIKMLIQRLKDGAI